MAASPRSTHWNAGYNAAIEDVASFLRDRAILARRVMQTTSAEELLAASQDVHTLKKARTR